MPPKKNKRKQQHKKPTEQEAKQLLAQKILASDTNIFSEKEAQSLFVPARLEDLTKSGSISELSYVILSEKKSSLQTKVVFLKPEEKEAELNPPHNPIEIEFDALVKQNKVVQQDDLRSAFKKNLIQFLSDIFKDKNNFVNYFANFYVVQKVIECIKQNFPDLISGFIKQLEEYRVNFKRSKNINILGISIIKEDANLSKYLLFNCRFPVATVQSSNNGCISFTESFWILSTAKYCSEIIQCLILYHEELGILHPCRLTPFNQEPVILEPKAQKSKKDISICEELYCPLSIMIESENYPLIHYIVNFMGDWKKQINYYDSEDYFAFYKIIYNSYKYRMERIPFYYFSSLNSNLPLKEIIKNIANIICLPNDFVSSKKVSEEMILQSGHMLCYLLTEPIELTRILFENNKKMDAENIKEFIKSYSEILMNKNITHIAIQLVRNKIEAKGALARELNTPGFVALKILENLVILNQILKIISQKSLLIYKNDLENIAIKLLRIFELMVNSAIDKFPVVNFLIKLGFELSSEKLTSVDNVKFSEIHAFIVQLNFFKLPINTKIKLPSKPQEELTALFNHIEIIMQTFNENHSKTLLELEPLFKECNVIIEENKDDSSIKDLSKTKNKLESKFNSLKKIFDNNQKTRQSGREIHADNEEVSSETVKNETSGYLSETSGLFRMRLEETKAATQDKKNDAFEEPGVRDAQYSTPQIQCSSIPRFFNAQSSLSFQKPQVTATTSAEEAYASSSTAFENKMYLPQKDVSPLEQKSNITLEELSENLYACKEDFANQLLVFYQTCADFLEKTAEKKIDFLHERLLKQGRCFLNLIKQTISNLNIEIPFGVPHFILEHADSYCCYQMLVENWNDLVNKTIVQLSKLQSQYMLPYPIDSLIEAQNWINELMQCYFPVRILTQEECIVQFKFMKILALIEKFPADEKAKGFKFVRHHEQGTEILSFIKPILRFRTDHDIFSEVSVPEIKNFPHVFFHIQECLDTLVAIDKNLKKSPESIRLVSHAFKMNTSDPSQNNFYNFKLLLSFFDQNYYVDWTVSSKPYHQTHNERCFNVAMMSRDLFKLNIFYPGKFNRIAFMQFQDNVFDEVNFSNPQLRLILENPKKIALVLGFLAKINDPMARQNSIEVSEQIYLFLKHVWGLCADPKTDQALFLSELFKRKSLNIAGFHYVLTTKLNFKYFGLNTNADYQYLNHMQLILDQFGPGESRIFQGKITIPEYLGLLLSRFYLKPALTEDHENHLVAQNLLTLDQAKETTQVAKNLANLILKKTTLDANPCKALFLKFNLEKFYRESTQNRLSSSMMLSKPAEKEEDSESSCVSSKLTS